MFLEGYHPPVVRASDGALTADKTFNLTVTEKATGTNYDIGPGVAEYDASGVQAGDTITIKRGPNATGTRGPLKISNANKSGTPITIRSDPAGQVILRRSSPGVGNSMILVLTNCHNFVLDGSTSAGATYGLKVMYASGSSSGNKDNPSHFIKLNGRSDDGELHHIWIDGGVPTYSSNGIGISWSDNTIAGILNQVASVGLAWTTLPEAAASSMSTT